MRSLLSIVCICVASQFATAGLIPATATGSTTTSAWGDFLGTAWTATSAGSAPFLGINQPGGVWDAPIVLQPNTLFIGADEVNAGDSQSFQFAQPVSDFCFYIENFDSSSVANIVSDGTVTLIAASQSITYTPTSGTAGTLSTSNASYNGEGDAVLKVSGGTTFLNLVYTGGEGANGVFYGFGQDVAGSPTSTSAVPEPSAFLMLLLAGCGISYFRRRQRRN